MSISTKVAAQYKGLPLAVPLNYSTLNEERIKLSTANLLNKYGTFPKTGLSINTDYNQCYSMMLEIHLKS
jgi:hypothetical protein